MVFPRSIQLPPRMLRAKFKIAFLSFESAALKRTYIFDNVFKRTAFIYLKADLCSAGREPAEKMLYFVVHRTHPPFFTRISASLNILPCRFIQAHSPYDCKMILFGYFGCEADRAASLRLLRTFFLCSGFIISGQPMLVNRFFQKILKFLFLFTKTVDRRNFCSSAGKLQRVSLDFRLSFQ